MATGVPPSIVYDTGVMPAGHESVKSIAAGAGNGSSSVQTMSSSAPEPLKPMAWTVGFELTPNKLTKTEPPSIADL